MYRRAFTGQSVPWNGGAQIPSGRAQQQLQVVRVAQPQAQPPNPWARQQHMGAPPQLTPQMPVPPAGTPATPQWREYVPDQYRDWVQIPTWYTITLPLGGNQGDQAQGTVQTRPERFIPVRLTYATTEDVLLGSAGGSSFLMCSSVAARTARVSFRDEFTHFMGTAPAFVAAVFGDSSGFLDFPKGILFQGKQTLYAELTRVLQPGPEYPGGSWDFVWAGVCLLPPGTQVSGSQ